MKRSRAFSQALVDKDMVTIFKKDPVLGRDSQVLVECHNGGRNLGALPIRLKTCCYFWVIFPSSFCPEKDRPNFV